MTEDNGSGFAPPPAVSGDPQLSPFPLPGIDDAPDYKRRSFTERENLDRVDSILKRHGWSTNREVPIYGVERDGTRRNFRVDLLVRHPDMPDAAGAIEVKSSIMMRYGTSPEGAYAIDDVVKQASDYVGCYVMATRECIRWAAVYPLRGFDENMNDPYTMGVLELASGHLKTHAMFHARWGGLTLIYLNRHKIWDEKYGLRKTGPAQLCGRRQVGGRRL